MNENIEFVLDKESEEYYSLKDDYSISNHKMVHEDILGACRDAIETFNRLVPIWEKINVVFVKRLSGDVLGRYRHGTSSSVPIVILCEKEIFGASDEYDLPISTCVETTIYHELGHAICEMESNELGGQYLVYEDEEDWVEGLAHSIYDQGTIPEDLKALIDNLLKEEPMSLRIRKLLSEVATVGEDGALDFSSETSDNKVTWKDAEDFAHRCQKIIDDDQKKHYPNMPENVTKILRVNMGKRYAKIISRDRGSVNNEKMGSAWAFIDLRNGDVLKPASWNAPAKHARGNIFDEHGGTKYVSSYGPMYLR